MSTSRAIEIARASAAATEGFGIDPSTTRRHLRIAESMAEQADRMGYPAQTDEILKLCRDNVADCANSIAGLAQYLGGMSIDDMNSPEAGALRRQHRILARAMFDAEFTTN